jgi:signal transduction histidine kinase
MARDEPGATPDVLERLGAEVDEAIDELRSVAHGVYPQILGDLGIGAALSVVARSSAIPVSVHAAWTARHSQAVETTVYFCCQECLQNAAKHAGAGASASILLDERDGWVSFCVEDDGAGFDPASVTRGAGLTNLADRLASVGGTLRIDAHPGRGTRVVGEIPVRSEARQGKALH